MSFWDQIRKLFSSGPASQPVGVTPATTSRTKQPAHKLELIGTTETVCPYCGVIPAKKPERKTKCRHCGNYIYVRTRSTDRQRVLVTELQVDELEEQESIINERHDIWIETMLGRFGHEETKARLRAQYGKALRKKHDADWERLNATSLGFARNGDWSFYAFTRNEMAQLLRKEGRSQQALSMFLEAAYLGLNGPKNIEDSGGIAFDPEEAFVQPRITHYIGELMDVLEYDLGRVQNAFMEMATIHRGALHLPVLPDDAWQMMKPRLMLFADEDEDE